MKINITKKQYWDLMRATYMADWMANAICDGDMEQDDGIKDVRNYIFSFAKEMGYEEYVKHDKMSGKYYATLDMDDEQLTRALIERYDAHSFWGEAAERLGERDFEKKYTKAEIEKMDDDEHFDKSMECEGKWAREFEEYGIGRVEIGAMKEDLKKWHDIKDRLIKDKEKKVFFHEREIWWCSIGKNIGFEQNGKGEEFTRPIIIVKRLSLDTCLMVPLTTSKKRKNSFSLGVLSGEEGESFAMVEQIRLIDAKRLGKKMGVLPKEQFEKLIACITETNFSP